MPKKFDPSFKSQQYVKHSGRQIWPDLTGVHLFLTYQKAARIAALPAAMLKIFGYFSHFEEVTKPLLESHGTSATTERKGMIVQHEYTPQVLFTLQHTAKEEQFFAKKAVNRSISKFWP